MEIDVEIILQKADVGAVLHKLGIPWERRNSKRGHELYFACPTGNHRDDPDKLRCSIAEGGKYQGHYNCWACDFKGNLIHLIRHMTGCGFRAALDFLERDYGSAELAGQDAVNFRLRMNKPDNTIANLPTFELPSDYTPILQANNSVAMQVRSWLAVERHITDEAMDRFEIGLSYNAKLGPMVVVPVRMRGKLHSVFTAQPRKGGLKRYPKNAPQGEIIFNYDACRSADRYIMVESILDVIKIWSVSRRDAMACFTNMISEHQLDLLRGFSEHGVMPDLDGQRGWDLVTRILPITGKSLWLYFPPIGKDPGDCTPEEIMNAIQWRKRYCDYESDHFEKMNARAIHRVSSVQKL